MTRKKAKRELNPKRIKATELYYISALAAVLKVHPNTISKMLKNGMRRVEGSYPYIIRGGFAIDYLNERQANSRTKLKQDEFFCLSCQKGVKAKNGIATFEIKAPKVGNLKAVCNICNTKTNRRISLKDFPKFEEVIKIPQLPNSLLIQGSDSSYICETKEIDKND